MYNWLSTYSFMPKMMNKLIENWMNEMQLILRQDAGSNCK